MEISKRRQLLKTALVFVFAFEALLNIITTANAENLCKKRAGAGPFPCCPAAYAQVCCSSVKSCDPSLTTGRTPAETYGPLTHKALCSLPWNTTACDTGFYRTISGSTKACPPGFFCPQDETCIIPCPLGAHCMPYTMTHVTKSYYSVCNRLGTCCVSSAGSVVAATLLESGVYACPGAKSPSTCPKGNYCPTATQKIICPKGYYCREGTTYAEKCPSVTICKEGESAPLQNAIGPLITISLTLLLLIAYCIFENYEALQFYTKHWWRWMINDLHYSVKDGVGHFIIAMEDFASCKDTYLVPKEYTIDLSFSSLTLTLKSSGKCVLQGVDGDIRSGEVTAIMGPSGAGKTTLLNVVSDKAFYGKVEGIIKANGEILQSLQKFKRITGFVPQEDVMHRTLTVEEVLTYQARLRLPPGKTSKEIAEEVSKVLKLLEISHIKRSYIGDEEQRGISGGQRKRVNIGMELIADPTLLFLDEPTSGLDSTSSLTVLNALRKVAEKGKLTVACVIHQPRYEIFSMFHNIILLAPGGRTVYQGSVLNAERYFSSLGFNIPEHCNPADFYMDVIGGAIHGDYSHEPEHLPRYWIEKQADFKEEKQASNGLPSCCKECGRSITGASTIARPQPNVVSQFGDFLAREIILQFRQIKTMLLDTFLVLLAGGVLGGLYREVKLNDFLTMSTMSSMAIGLVSCIPALRMFGQSRPVFWRESGAGVNRLSYFLAGNFAQLPQIVLMPIIYLSLQYTFTAPRGFLKEHYMVTLATWFAVSGMGYCISCIFNPRNAQMATVLFILISSLLAGSSPTICQMDDLKVIGPACYSMAYARWYIEALFETEVKHYAAVHQNTVNYFAFNRNYGLDNFYTCIIVLFAFGLVSRVISFLCLVFLNRGKQQ
eukprot:gene16777-18472_t